MNTQKMLVGLLGLQVVLAAIMWMPGGDSAVALQPLFDIEQSAITRVEIAGPPRDDAPKEPLVLEKVAGTWVVASENGYPAKIDKVDEVLAAVADIHVRKPVATQASSQTALKVSDAAYDKKVTLTVGGATHAFTVGAAGSKKAYVRRDGETEVFEAKGLSAWSLADNSRSYFEAQYVNIDESTVLSLSVTNDNGTITLARQDGGWLLANLPDGQLPNQSAIDGLARKTVKIRMVEPVGKATPDMGLAGGTRVEWSWTENDEAFSNAYVIGALDETQRFVKSDDSEFVVKVATSALDPIVNANIADLVQNFDNAGEL